MDAFSIQRQAANSLWLVLARVFAQALALIFTALVARSLGERGLGQFAFVSAVIFLANLATTFGTDTLIIRELAGTRQVATPLLGNALWIQIFLSVVFIGGAFLWASPLVALYSLSLLPLAFYTVYSSSLRALERMDLYLQVTIASSLVQMLSAAIVFFTQASLTILIIFLIVAQVLTALIAAVVCRKNLALKFRWVVSTETLAPIIHAALPFAILTTLAFIYQRLGIFTLSFSLGDQATGWFSAAARLVDATKIVPQAWLGALLPALSRLRYDASTPSRSSQNLVMLFGVASAAILSVFAPSLITLIYGNRFESAILPLQILAWSLLPYAFTAHLTLVLVARGSEWVVLRGTLVAMIFTVIPFAILVSRFGLLGASWATVLAEWAQGFIFWRLFQNESRRTR